MAAVDKKKKRIFDGHYEILSIVGRGSHSVVYRARHVTLPSSEIALKVLLNKKQGRSESMSTGDRLRKEALAMVSARHKYVVRLDDFHSVDDLSYLAMEYAPFRDLVSYVSERGGKLGAEQAELFLIQCAKGLDFIHKVGMIHRDLKPSNILVVNEDEIRIADFGVATLPGEQSLIKDLESGVGTMSYMAPEVLKGICYDQKSDIYSLGVSFYELLAGKHPFEDAPLARQLEIRQDNRFTPLSVLAPKAPPHLIGSVTRAISYDSKDRFASAKELLDALRQKHPYQIRDTAGPPATEINAEIEDESEAAPKKRRRRRRKKLDRSPEQTQLQSTQSEATEPVEATLDEDLDDTYQEPENTELEREPTHIQNTIADSYEEVEINTDQDVSEPLSRDGAAGTEIIDEPPPFDIFSVTEEQEDAQEYELSEGQDLLHREHQRVQPDRAGFSRRAPSNSSSRYRIIAVVVILAAIMLAYSYRQLQFIGVRSGVSWFATTESDPLTFPSLPQGIYRGTVNSLITYDNLDLVMYVPAAGKIIVLLGIEGWSPALADITESSEASAATLTVRSSGFILSLSGHASGDRLEGAIVNRVTGETGSWHAVKQRERR